MAKEKTFKIIIDQTPHDWSEPTITGLQIRELAGVDESYGVWQQLPGPEDPEVDDSQEIDISEPGTEKFFTGKKTTTEGSFVNADPA